MRILWKILVPLALVLVIVWWVQRGWTPEVAVAPATRGTAVNAVTGTVEIRAVGDLWVRTERQGELVEVRVNEGDTVEKGQLVAVQASRLLDFQIEQERVRLEAAQARLALPVQSEFDVANVREEVEAMRLQVEMGQLSRARLEERERELRKTEARLEEERIQRRETAGVLTSRVAEMEYEKERTRLIAPVEGEVVEVLGIVGDRQNANQSILRIISHARLVEMELSEEDVGGVERGDPVTLRLASYPGQEFTARVNKLYATANASTKTRKLLIDVDADNSVLVPGLTGEGYLIKEEREDAVLVPRRALIGRRIFVVKDGRVEIRAVEPGFLSLNRAEIRSGLEPGELVILEGQDLLSDGQSVSPRAISN